MFIFTIENKKNGAEYESRAFETLEECDDGIDIIMSSVMALARISAKEFRKNYVVWVYDTVEETAELWNESSVWWVD